MKLKNKKILLGITGGIAAYKCQELARNWVKAGAEVEVILTRSAMEFVTPLTLETLIGKRVHTDLFPKNEYSATVHIDLADWADVIVIAPATANFIGKLRNGIGDDLLSTVCLAGYYKMVVAPAMNSNMWKNPAVKENINTIKERGMLVIRPDSGDLACGYTGPGRLPAVSTLEHWVNYALSTRKPLAGKTLLVTAGPTEENIDPVRMLTNRSSGKMGFAIARAAFFAGAHVVLVSGPTVLAAIPGVTMIPVQTALEMDDAVQKEWKSADIFIATAAVSDYRPAEQLNKKRKKDGKAFELDMVANPDILAKAGTQKGNRILVGFAVETDNGISNAKKKITRKNLDLIVLNNPREEGAAFAVDTNKVTLISADGSEKTLPLQSKDQVADSIMDKVIELMTGKAHA